MKHFFLFLAFSFSAFAADTPIAIVKGTNVVFVTVADLTIFANRVGESNVVITTAELGAVRKGWSYSGGVLRDQNRQPLPQKVVDAKSRETKSKSFKAIYELRKNNWDTLKVNEQADVLGQLCALIDMIIELHPELLEPKPEPQ